MGRRSRALIVSSLVIACSSGPRPAGESSESGSAGSSAEAGEATASETGSSSVSSEGSEASSSETQMDMGADDETTGEPPCVRNVVLMGYWPPTNEMLRQWSTNPDQNPDGWTGQNWGGHGFDVYAFFPEFPPDGDPTNDGIGDPGAVGSRDSDLQVDYQDTSADFWRIVDDYQPVLMITTSRGGQIGWEVEALEGGHGGPDGQADPSLDWSSDGYGLYTRPTQDSIEARSWQGISTYREGVTLDSQLPMADIVAAADALGLVDVQIDQGTSGNFLSGFLGLHGLLYNALAPHNAAAGHIHVGFGVPVDEAEALMEASLQALLEAHPADTLDCSPVP